MRFSDTGYYIERYVKCHNCGVLVYDDGVTSDEPELAEMIFCTDWCKTWKAQRLAGVERPNVKGAQCVKSAEGVRSP